MTMTQWAAWVVAPIPCDDSLIRYYLALKR